MYKNIIHKVPQGKMLRIEADITDSVIKDIKITGDFFVHPEERICDIENFLIGKKIQNTEKELQGFLNKEYIQIIGFTAKDLQYILVKYK